MKLEDFKNEVLNYAENNKPKQWRKGQAVFNYIDKNYGVARAVQFMDNVDCFYNDKFIDEFIDKAFSRISNIENNI